MNMQYLPYIFLGIIVLLSYAVLFLIYKNRKGKNSFGSQDFYGDSLEIIASAQKQANEIVEKAVESTKHILFETEYVKQDITHEMQNSLSRVAEESVKLVQGRSVESEKAFRDVVDEIKAEFEKVAEKRLSSIEQIVESETNDFKQLLIKETIGSQQFIGKKIGSDFQDVQAQIAEYKRGKMVEVDKNINSIIKEVVRETLGASITIPVHEELVLASLENAKKGGLFRELEENSRPEQAFKGSTENGKANKGLDVENPVKK